MELIIEKSEPYLAMAYFKTNCEAMYNNKQNWVYWSINENKVPKYISQWYVYFPF